MKGTLFTTTTCAKCPSFKAFLQENIHFDIDTLDERDSRFRDLAGKYDVTVAPTLIIEDDEGKELLRTSEQADVAIFLNSH